MKYIADDNPSPNLERLELTKINITDGEECPESVWIKIDEERQKGYIQNNLVCFMPFPSWGFVVDMTKVINNTFDISKIKGESPDTCTLIVHPEMITSLKDDDMLDEEGNLNENYYAYLEAQYGILHEDMEEAILKKVEAEEINELEPLISELKETDIIDSKTEE